MSSTDTPLGEDKEPARVFVFGAGYSAGRFVSRLVPDTVCGVTARGEAGLEAWRDRGVAAFLFDGEREDASADSAIAGALREATHLVVSVPPGHESAPGVRVGGANASPGDPVLRRFGGALEAGAPNLSWIGYLSTVGVYGDHGGAWIDEAAELRAASPRSRERLAAEAGWATLAKRRGVPVAVLRLSGIYGPERNALASLANGTARRVVKPGQVFNRIHVDDIAGALAHLAVGRIGGVVNVTDDEPAPPQDVVAFAAALAGVEPPPETPFDPAAMSEMARSFWGENKRVSNVALKETGYRFLHPTYREGLNALRSEIPDRLPGAGG